MPLAFSLRRHAMLDTTLKKLYYTPSLQHGVLIGFWSISLPALLLRFCLRFWCGPSNCTNVCRVPSARCQIRL
jgi:hypothetical protein